jgi:hypothetical protein
MKTEEIKQKLIEYINRATPERLEEILSFVEEEETEYAVETAGAPWKDEEFAKEMNRRMEEIDSGKVQGIPWEEVHKRVIDKYKKPE